MTEKYMTRAQMNDLISENMSGLHFLPWRWRIAMLLWVKFARFTNRWRQP